MTLSEAKKTIVEAFKKNKNMEFSVTQGWEFGNKVYNVELDNYTETEKESEQLAEALNLIINLFDD